MNDSEIVRMFLDRNEEAISLTKTIYGKKLQRLAYQITEDFESAEECENDTYMKAWESIPPHEPYDYFYSFLVRITRHIALNICRDRNALKRKAEIEELTVELQDTIPDKLNKDVVSDLVLQEILNSFLQSLSEEKRKVFIRRYWYLDSVSQIAKGYGISESKAKIILYRCREQLKGLLEKEDFTI